MTNIWPYQMTSVFFAEPSDTNSSAFVVIPSRFNPLAFASFPHVSLNTKASANISVCTRTDTNKTVDFCVISSRLHWCRSV